MRLGQKTRQLSADPIDGDKTAPSDFIVACDDASIFGLSEGDRKGVAKRNWMGGLHLSGGRNTVLVWKHQSNG
jgi:hypothetical protein